MRWSIKNDYRDWKIITQDSAGKISVLSSWVSPTSIKTNPTQGQVIGKSGESIINASLGNHLHFALEYDNQFINPLKSYNKTVYEVIK